MPRPKRIFIPGAIYHVYARVGRGEPVFAESSEAAAFVDIVRATKKRDGFIVFAWALLSNHYHIALRTGRVPMWRSMASIQGRSSKGFNRRHGVLGPLWQGRYRAKLVEDDSYLQQLVAYIHLNPVKAGLVEDPADYRWSGHAELLKRQRSPLLDADETLSIYGDTRRVARRIYVRTLRGAGEKEWLGERPGQLPWWRGPRERDDHIEPSHEGPFVDYLGRSTEPVPPRVTAESFLHAASEALDVQLAELAGRGKSSDIAQLRGLITLLGVERFRQKINRLAEVLRKHPGSLSYAAKRFAELRVDDPAARRLFDQVDADLQNRFGE
jgi:REP element-mobilizing transposase RayT